MNLSEQMWGSMTKYKINRNLVKEAWTAVRAMTENRGNIRPTNGISAAVYAPQADHACRVAIKLCF
jgi:hypothetical protein